MMRVSSLILLLAAACATAPEPVKPPVVEVAEPPMPVSDEAPRADPLSAPADVAAAPADARVTRSGLAMKKLKEGSGRRPPSSFSVVRVHYSGWTTDGQLFDSSVKRGTPAEFPLNGVIGGWREGVKLMAVGEKRRMWIPEELAYKGMSGPQGTLVFEIELLEIVSD